MKLLALLISGIAFGLTALAQQKNASPTAKPPSGPPVKLLSQLDADGYGLYDDRERKALLDVFLQECPELRQILLSSAAPVTRAATTNPEDFEPNATARDKPATPGAAATAAAQSTHPFDRDGDGKVTVLEQSQGRPPLSLLVPKRIIESANKIPWAIDLFPEWLSSAYLQEDVPVGAVPKHAPRGVILLDAEQADASLQPKKSEPRGGVEFVANSGQFFSMPGYRAARWDYRWCIFTFRVDGKSGTDNETILLDLNQGNGPNRSSPRIAYHKTSGLSVQYAGLNKGGIDRRVMRGANVEADGKSWNVLVCGIRYGRLFASLNGTALATPRSSRTASPGPRSRSLR
jgi:hypothetical protein